MAQVQYRVPFPQDVGQSQPDVLAMPEAPQPAGRWMEHQEGGGLSLAHARLSLSGPRYHPCAVAPPQVPVSARPPFPPLEPRPRPCRKAESSLSLRKVKSFTSQSVLPSAPVTSTIREPPAVLHAAA